MSLLGSSRRIITCFRIAAVLTATLLPTRPALAQADSASSAVNVFLDCGFRCDEDFIRTEITYVNWVRDRTVADVHMLVTTQPTGGAGTEYTVAFLGQRGFAGLGDTLRYVARTTNSADDTRRGLTRTMELGLVRFVARTAVADRLEIAVAPRATSEEEQTAPARDPWKAWVFRTSVNGFTYGEKLFVDRNGFLSVSANRTTAAWKSSFSANGSYNESKIRFQDYDDVGNVTFDTTYTTIRRDWGVDGLVVKSINEHWSAGLRGDIGSNTYYNQRRSMRITPAIEYDLFPYAEATRRQLRIQYGAGMSHFAYEDTTIFFKIRETLPVHYISLAYSTRQPWGSVNVGANHNAFLNDGSKRNTRVNGSVDVRLFRGLSFRSGGSYSWIRDQLYLRKGSQTQSEVLLRQQQLLTGFRYNFNFGLSYTFGSIYNNVVNPRFGGTGGGEVIFF